MKHILLALIFSSMATVNASDLTLADLPAATAAANEQAQVIYGDDQIISYIATLDGHDAEVEVLSAFADSLIKSEYHCHEHGAEIDCHNEGEEVVGEYDGSELVPYSMLRAGELGALNLLTPTLRANVKSYKIWGSITHDDHDDHGDHKEDEHEEIEIWARFNLVINGQARSVFAYCHEASHGGGPTRFDCHIERTGPANEPQF